MAVADTNVDFVACDNLNDGLDHSAAVRGKRGGYRLNRPPGHVTVLEIVEAVEGPIVLNFCQHKPPRCDRKNCPVRPVWGQLQKTIRDKLGALTLAQCLEDEPEKP